MWESPEFWVAMAFLVFMMAAALPVKRALVSALDARSERIRSDIDEAQALREEAQKTLAEYKRKQRDALKEAEEIIAHAKVEAGRLREQAQRDMEASLQRREQSALEKIAQAETQALQDVRSQTVDLALAATAKLLTDNLNKQRSDAMIEQAIQDLAGKLH